MPSQIARIDVIRILETLSDALYAEQDVVVALRDAYKQANEVFRHEADQVDPACVMAGLQAAALGMRAITGWLIQGSSVAGVVYYNRGAQANEWLTKVMDDLGVVIPDEIAL